MQEEELRQILAWRLLIARAAASESLSWWDDESLTDAGLAVARRLFARQPIVAVLRLSQRAASARHRAALEQFAGAIHLFNLGDEIELLLDEALDAHDFEIPPPITSREDLRQTLMRRDLGSEPEIRQRVGPVIELIAPVGAAPVAQARRLVSGYLYGDREMAVFPYLRLNQTAR